MKEDFMQDAQLSRLLSEASLSSGFCGGAANVQLLAGDGSDRKFYRIRQGRSRFVALVSARQKEQGTDENDSYYLIGKHLACCNIPVPRIFWADRAEGLFLLDDLGDCHLQRLVSRAGVDLCGIYRRVLKILLKLHERVPRGFEESFCFDTPIYDPPFVYSRELEYFRKAFLETYLGLNGLAEVFRPDFENLAEAAGVNSPSLIMHRDFQSRNIMVNRGALHILDFQGMRFGPPAYDLASLLVDPYVILHRSLQEGLVELYWSGARKFLNCSYREFNASYCAVRLCRNLQALAAYAFLGLVKGKTSFLQYIPRAWSRLHEWINGPCSGQYPRLQRSVNSIQADRRGSVFKRYDHKEKFFVT